MRSWYNQNYFKPNLLIRKNGNANYFPLDEYKNCSFTKLIKKRKILKSLFEKSRKETIEANLKKEKIEDEQWIYLDRNKKIQGPFPTSMMRSWYKDKLLYPELPIELFELGKTNLSGQRNFIPIKDYMQCTFILPEKKKIKTNKETKRASNNFSSKETSRKWYYRDSQGVERGSFSLEIMRRWFTKKYIPLDTPVRREGEKQFIQIHMKRIIFEDKEFQSKIIKYKRQWEYIDDGGLIRGPFEKYVIQRWHEFGWLPYDIRIRKVGEKFFNSWGDQVASFEQESDGDKNEVEKTQIQLEDLCPSSLEDQWFYIDEKKKVQGPFRAEAMHGWFEETFFDLNTKVKCNNESRFVSLKERRPPPSWLPFVSNFFPKIPVIKTSKLILTSPLLWFYKAQGNKHIGPFPTSQINAWHRDKHFNDSVKVCLSTDPLKKWKPIINTVCAFHFSSQEIFSDYNSHDKNVKSESLKK